MIMGSFEVCQVGEQVYIRNFPYRVLAESSYAEFVASGGLEENHVRAGEHEAYFYEVEPWFKLTIVGCGE